MTDIGFAAEGRVSARDGAAGAGLDAVLPGTKVLVAALVVLGVLKFTAVFLAAALPDEGYYWLWGQHPDWSYYDHPPLGGWVHWLTGTVFGNGTVAARLATLPTFAGTLLILWYWCGRLAPPDLRLRAFLTGTAMWLASPLMLVYQSLAIHDHLLIVLSLAALHFFVLFAESREAGAPRYRLLYLFAVMLGLAALSKYNAVFVAAGIGVWILLQRDRLAWLGDVHLWLAALVTAAMLSPVLYWNWSHGWPSFQFYTHDRIGHLATSPFDHIYNFTVQSFVLVSPVLMVAFLRFLIRGAPAVPALLRGPAASVFLIGTATWYAMCLVTPAAHYWNVTSYLLPLAVATTLNYSSAIFAVLLSALILREPTGVWRWSAVALGFAGVVLIAQPWGGELPLLGAAIALGAALMIALISVQLRDLGRTEHPFTIVFYFSLFSVPVLGLAMPFVAKAHPPQDWLLLLACGVIGVLGQVLLTAALRYGTVANVIVMDYSGLIWATLFGWLVFTNLPGASFWFGAPLVVGAGLLIAWREHTLGMARKAALEPKPL